MADDKKGADASSSSSSSSSSSKRGVAIEQYGDLAPPSLSAPQLDAVQWFESRVAELTGYSGHLSDAQRATLAKLRERIHRFVDDPNPEAPSPQFQSATPALLEATKQLARYELRHEPSLLRFLRAREFVLDAAYVMIMNSFLWRVAFDGGRGVDGIALESIERELAVGKAYYRGYDKRFRPVIYIRVRLHDKNASNIDEVKRLCVWTAEQGKRLLHAPQESVTLVYDMKDFSVMKNMDYEFLRFLVDMFEARYPETLGLCLVLDAPWVFWACWSMIKGWLPPKTKDKIHFVPTADLPKYIDKEVLLKEYGGDDDYVYDPKRYAAWLTGPGVRRGVAAKESEEKE